MNFHMNFSVRKECVVLKLPPAGRPVFRTRGELRSQRRGIQIATTAGPGCNIFTDENVCLHPHWLRERCLSENSVQAKTRQPLHQPHELAWPMVVEHAEFDGDARGLLLNVRFGDGHASTFVGADIEREARSATAHGIKKSDNQTRQRHGSTALVFFGPQISLNPSSGEVEQIRYSNRSGGYAPTISDVDEMDLLFRARRRFAELLNEESKKIRFHVREGEIWVFNNLRVLH